MRRKEQRVKARGDLDIDARRSSSSTPQDILLAMTLASSALCYPICDLQSLSSESSASEDS
jgi:hypothetical protein